MRPAALAFAFSMSARRPRRAAMQAASATLPRTPWHGHGQPTGLPPESRSIPSATARRARDAAIRIRGTAASSAGDP
jgi:hypothetical protein